MSKPDMAITTISEAARQTRVFSEADVLVVGGGPGGHSAAVAAARSGAKTVLVERYGHLGGMPTGGLITMLHSMSDGTNQRQIAGICQEWIDRLDARNAVEYPRKEDIGLSDAELLRPWRNPFFVVEERLIYGARFDPEILKCVLNDMVEEAGVELLLHSWGTEAIMENGEVKGCIFESKSGRQAVLAKAVIDGTGDGDLLPSAGVKFEREADKNLRTTKPALCFEFGNVDVPRMYEFRENNPKQNAELMQELKGLDGFTMFFRTTREDTVHFNMFLNDYDILNVVDLTRVEVDVRKRMLVTFDFLKKNMPGFKDSFIMLTAPQLGTRGSRRLVGAYKLTEADARAGKTFDDTIAEFPPLRGISPEKPHVSVPYRCLVPETVDGLLVAGRSFSSDEIVNEHFNTISHCVAMGQAAGTAAVMAVRNGTRLRDVDTRKLQDLLIEQGVPMPGLKR